MVRVYPITPQSQFKKNSRATVPLRRKNGINTFTRVKKKWVVTTYTKATQNCIENYVFKSKIETCSVATGITKVAKSPFTLHPHLLRKVVTQFHQQNIT